MADITEFPIPTEVLDPANYPEFIGPTGATGPQGETGPAGADGVGVPAGGTTGQVLAKTSATDYATEWVDQSGGGGSPGGSDTQVQFNDGGAFGGDAGLAFNKTSGSLTVGGKTVTTNAPVVDLSQTWNASGTTFTGVKLNVTDTASGANSLLADFQVGGVRKFWVRKDGTFFAAGGFLGEFAVAGGIKTNSYVVVAGILYFNDSAAIAAALTQDAANTLAQRNGVNAQTFRLYNTYTDASNYERGVFDWTTNAAELTIGAQNAGTGAARVVRIASNGNIDLRPSGATNAAKVTFSTTGSGSLVVFNGTAASLVLGVQTSSGVAFKRTATTAQVRLADDSAFTNIQGKLTTETNAVAETPTATHTLTLYDAAGTAYKVLAVAA